jgi:acyl-CoA thioesterase-1
MKRYGLGPDSVSILAVLAAGVVLTGYAAGGQSGHQGTASQSANAAVVYASETPARAERSPGASRGASGDIASEPLIACFGDSLTAGLGVDPEQSYPAVLQRMLDQAGYHYRVVNEGVSGDTTKDGLERIDRILAKRPRIVVLEFGGNDGLRGLPVTTAQHNLATMLSALKQSGAKVALAGITIPPQYGPQYITQFNAMYPALAREFHVPLLPFLLQDVYGVPGDIQPDGVHPTAQGARQVAANVQKLIQPLLKK